MTRCQDLNGFRFDTRNKRVNLLKMIIRWITRPVMTILKNLRDAICPHIPELVWTRGSGELGILPIGESDLTRRVSDRITQYFPLEILAQSRNHPSPKLIFNREQNNINMVIIDYKTAFDSERNQSTGNEVDYSGGYICWPKRLLQLRTLSCMPEPADGLFALSWWSFTCLICFHADSMSSE